VSAPVEKPWTDVVAAEALRMFPPKVRTAILNTPEFHERFDVGGDAVLTLNITGAKFLRSTLFEICRRILNGDAAEGEIASKQGEVWNVTAAEPFGIKLSRANSSVILQEMSCLSPASEVRIAWFVDQAGAYGVMDAHLAEWRGRLTERPLADDEVGSLLDELRFTPPHVFTVIREHLQRGSFGPLDLVPGDIRYFERLTGASDRGSGLQELFATTVAAQVGRLLDGRSDEGVKAVFLLASHSLLADLVDVSAIPRQTVVDSFVWIASHGDRVSQVGAIECGLRILNEYPELEASVAAMTRALVVDDPADRGGRLRLASALVAFVEGEIARRRIVPGRPPFWRRLSSIAHASVIEREVIRRQLNVESIAKWALNSGGSWYYLQTLVDLRREPRWFPDFISPEQLKAEWLGRVAAAAERYRDNVPPGELDALLWGKDGDSVKSRLALPEAWLPGPLEGGMEAVRELPSDLEAQIRASLEAQELTPASFFGLVNAALIVRVDSELSQAAAQGLRRVGYRLRQFGENKDPFPFLNALAKVAAVTRSKELAGEVRVLVRAARHRSSEKLSPEAMSRVALVAAAAVADESAWGSFLGEWLTELAFLEMTLDEAVNLRSQLHMLLHIDPTLWETCGRADAAVGAYLDSSSAAVP